MAEIDWPALRRTALEACEKAYAPYSRFPVGAAALVDDGRVVAGCNVENASYGVTLCAECGLVSALALSGGGHLVALVCVDATGRPLMPCGRCRQLLHEHAAPGMLVQSTDGPITMDALLPRAFGPADLDRVADTAVVAGPLPVPPAGSADPPTRSGAPTPRSVSPAPMPSVGRPTAPRPPTAPAPPTPPRPTAPVIRPASPVPTAPPGRPRPFAAVRPGPDETYDPARHPYDRHDDSGYGGTPAAPDTFDPEDFQ